MSVKILFYITICLLALTLADDVYSYYQQGIFNSPLSIIINSVTLLFLIIYLLTIIHKRRRLRKKLKEEYDKIYSKN